MAGWCELSKYGRMRAQEECGMKQVARDTPRDGFPSPKCQGPVRASRATKNLNDWGETKNVRDNHLAPPGSASLDLGRSPDRLGSFAQA